ncbi:putative ribonuclease H-like domain-containing protein [Tanacetum coccineum]
MNKGVLSYENEVFQSVLISRISDIEDSPVNDRYAEGMHAIPPPMIGIYIPSGPNKEIDDSQFTYGPKQSKPSESDARSSDFNTCESNCSEETHESMPEPVVNEPKVVSQPKVWSDAPIIKEYESNSEDEHSPKPDKKDCSGLMAKKLGLGYGGSFSHLIRDCDFHEKRMAKQAELNNRMCKGSGQREIRRAVPTNVARKVNTVKPIVNNARPKAGFHKTLLPFRKPFNRTTALRTNFSYQKVNTAEDYPQRTLQNKRIVDSGCSKHMTGNKAYLAEYQDFNGGPVAFGGSKGYITGKGKIKTGKLDFEDVCFVKELQHFNLFSVSQMCDKKNKVLFTDTECLVLSPEFKLPDENQVLLRIPRQNNMYSFNLENIVPSGGLAYLIAKATIDESNKWHRRLGHVNFKNLNKLVKGNLVRGLPSKIFQNDHTCVACQKGKQHKASCKAKSVSSISQPLQLLHMDLFGPTSVRSLNHKTYCLVITDDFSRFSWVFFLRTKDETSGILKDFIRQIQNQLNQKVKTIRCDNGTEFKNRDFIEFCGSKGIKREYSNARTPQQNGVAERKNRTLIEAARTMLADSFLPNTFWAEAVSTACYVLNRVLVTKPQNKTPYELITGKGPNWLFDLDYLTDSMNYQPVRSENQANKTAGPKEANHSAGTQDNIDAGNSKMEAEPAQDYFVLPIWSSYTSTVKSSETKNEAEALRKEFAQDTEDLLLQARAARATSTNTVNTASTLVSTDSPLNAFSTGGPDLNNTDQDDSQIPTLKDIYDNPSDGIFTNASYDDEGAVADFTNLESTVNVSPIPTSRIHSIPPITQILRDPKSAVQTRSKVHKSFGAYAFKISEALEDESWVDTMQKELLQNKIQKTVVYQMDVKSAILYGKIDEEVYVSQPLGFVDSKFPRKVYKVVKALYGLHQAPRAWISNLARDPEKFDYLCEDMLPVLLIETQKSLTKDEEVADVDVHLYRSKIKVALLMNLNSSRLDINVIAVCACSRFQVTPKTSHLNAVKRIFRYLKGKPKLGLWYPRVSSFDLEAYSDSDYAGANLDRKSTTGGCQFLGRRLISWQCKKQTIVATSTTKAKYVAATNCCGQNPVFHSKTKHIEIRHHFIRDAYEKNLIQVLKIHTNDNVGDLLPKAFDVSRMVLLLGLGKEMLFGLVLRYKNGDQPPVTDSSSSHDTTQDFRDSLEDTNGSEGTQVQSSHDSPLSGDHTSEKAKGGLNLEELFVLCTNLSNRVLTLETSKDAQAAEILKLKDQIKKLKRKCKPSISHQLWMPVMILKKRLGRKESVSKHGRKNAKPQPTLDAFDDLDADGRDYIETDDVVKEGRQSNETEELNKGSGEKGGSTEELVSNVEPKTVSTARPELSTARPDVDAARQEDSAVEPKTPPTTTSIFDDEDITMAQTLIKMKEEKAKEKGVSIKDIEDSSRPARSILSLKPLPILNPKDKGKSVLKEPEPAKKMTRSDFDAAHIARDAEIARQLQVNLQAEVERERQREEEEASKAAIAETYDEVQEGIDADALISDDASKKDSKEAVGVHKQKVLEEPKVEVKQDGHEESIRKRPGRRLKMKATKKHGTECIYYRIFRSDGSSRWIKTFFEMVTRFDRLDLVELYNLVMKKFETTTPEGVDLCSYLDTGNMGLQVKMLILCLDSFKSRLMSMEAMMEERRIFKCWFYHHTTNGHQFTMSNKHQELASPEQTASGKDFSNPLIADSLLKTIWFLTYHASQ